MTDLRTQVLTPFFVKSSEPLWMMMRKGASKGRGVIKVEFMNRKSEQLTTMDLKQTKLPLSTGSKHDMKLDHTNGKLSKDVHSRDMQTFKKTESKRSRKRGIFISYSPQALYSERKFVLELVREFKEQGLVEDIWFDFEELKDEISGPFLTSCRLEVAEKCKAAILVLSREYFLTRQTRLEADILLSRLNNESMDGDSKAPVLLVMKYSDWVKDTDNGFLDLSGNITIDLSGGTISRLSESEKVSHLIHSWHDKLHSLSEGQVYRFLPPLEEAPGTSEFSEKQLLCWTVKDVQDWLSNLHVHEKYMISFEEFCINGFLLEKATDKILTDVLAVDSQICRKKILQQIKFQNDEENKRKQKWLKFRGARSKQNQVYVICDPADHKLVQILKNDFYMKGIKALSHEKLGQSKEEYLLLNAKEISSSSYTILLLTSSAINSPFVINEIMFAEWLGKPMVIALFENIWKQLRLSLWAILADCQAINFETALYIDGFDFLYNEIKPARVVSGVVYEQRYLNQVSEGVCPFQEMVHRIDALKLADVSSSTTSSSEASLSSTSSPTKPNSIQPRAFISYQWDHQSKVRMLVKYLESNGVYCWSDMDFVTKRPVTQSLPRMTPAVTNRVVMQDNLNNQIERNIRDSVVVLLCITPSYFRSSNCLKEVELAASFDKPIFAVLLQWAPWPPDSVSSKLRRIFASVRCTDLSNEKLFTRNVSSLASKVSRYF